jgi:hypothetical protein
VAQLDLTWRQMPQPGGSSGVAQKAPLQSPSARQHAGGNVGHSITGHAVMPALSARHATNDGVQVQLSQKSATHPAVARQVA